MVWNAVYLGLVCAEAQICSIFTYKVLPMAIYIVYTVNEPMLWQAPLLAAFDAANSSLLSATFQWLC